MKLSLVLLGIISFLANINDGKDISTNELARVSNDGNVG